MGSLWPECTATTEATCCKYPTGGQGAECDLRVHLELVHKDHQTLSLHDNNGASQP